MTPPKLTKTAILDVLDESAKRFEFPMLDNGYVYPVDVRLSAYGDGSRWAIVVEWLGVHSRALSFINSLCCYGNCLQSLFSEKEFVSSEAYRAWRAAHRYAETLSLYPVSDGPGAPLFEPDAHLDMNPKAKNLKIRTRIVRIPRDPEVYRTRGVALKKAPRIRLYELMRVLAPEHRSLLVATEEEIHRLVPPDLPLLLRLDEWEHPGLADDQLPSGVRTFRMIAAVLVNREPARYRPTRRPNTHWSNWPQGGTL